MGDDDAVGEGGTADERRHQGEFAPGRRHALRECGDYVLGALADGPRWNLVLLWASVVRKDNSCQARKSLSAAYSIWPHYPTNPRTVERG